MARATATTATLPDHPGMPAPMPWHTAAWTAAVASGVPSILVHGAPGIGERRFALAMAACWLCEAPSGHSPRPCLECPGCKLIEAGNHPDLRVVEPAAMTVDAEDVDADGNGDEDIVEDKDKGKGKSKAAPSQLIVIGQLRPLNELAQISSHRGGARVVVIHPADAMNVAASNALLKMLEEPPAGMRFLLVAHRLQRVSATVRSRCMRVPLPMPTLAQAVPWLQAQGVEDAANALALAGGSPQVALDNADPVRAALSRAWLRCVTEGSATALSAARETKEIGAPQVLSWLVQWTHDLARVKAGAAPRFHPLQATTLQRLASSMTLRAVTRLHRTLLQRQRWIRHPLNAQLTLEALWLDYFQGMGGR
ncbi:MAG: DNA polymerase III subunit delta' [Burkholderiales bacterium]|nr:DNA polymerase III subunit delta' [Burkholderiales bacterium]